MAYAIGGAVAGAAAIGALAIALKMTDVI